MFLSCCCRGQKEGKKRRKGGGGGGGGGGTDRVSPDPGYQPSLSFTPHSPIFTIQSQRPARAQSSSLSSEEFFYYQVTWRMHLLYSFVNHIFFSLPLSASM